MLYWIDSGDTWNGNIFRLNKRLGKRSWGWWFETSSCSLWRHCNGIRDEDRFWKSLLSVTMHEGAWGRGIQVPIQVNNHISPVWHPADEVVCCPRRQDKTHQILSESSPHVPPSWFTNSHCTQIYSCRCYDLNILDDANVVSGFQGMSQLLAISRATIGLLAWRCGSYCIQSLCKYRGTAAQPNNMVGGRLLHFRFT